MKLTYDQYSCVSEKLSLDGEEEFDWKFEIVSKKKHYRHNGEETTFVFFMDEKWLRGSFWCWEDSGIDGYEDIELEEVEPYQVTVTKYRLKKNVP